MFFKPTFGERVFDTMNVAFFVLFSLTIIFPFLRFITFSFSDDITISKGGLFLFPTDIFLDNWRTVLFSEKMWRSFYQTVVVTLSATAYQLFLSSSFAYSLSRKVLPNRRMWTFILLITMFFSGGLIPTFILYKELGLIDSTFSLILAGVSAWNVLILRNFFMAIPESLHESANIDGANEVGIYFRIVLPLSMPVIATVTLWLLVGNWNAWFNNLLYIHDPNKTVLQLLLRQIILENSVNIANVEESIRRVEQAARQGNARLSPPSVQGLKAASLLFVTIPILITYPFLQKYFVKGILVGSLKG